MARLDELFPIDQGEAVLSEAWEKGEFWAVREVCARDLEAETQMGSAAPGDPKDLLVQRMFFEYWSRDRLPDGFALSVESIRQALEMNRDPS